MTATVAVTESKTKSWKVGWNDTLGVLIDNEMVSEFIRKVKEKVALAQAKSLVSQPAWQYAEGALNVVNAWENDETPPDFVV